MPSLATARDANRQLRRLKTYLGQVIRDVVRKIEGDAWLKAHGVRSVRVSIAGHRRRVTPKIKREMRR
jgi:hypothetical protein